MVGTRSIAVCLALLTPATTVGQELTEDRVRELVLETILENPEIVLEAVGLIERREQERQARAIQASLLEHRELLENDTNAPAIGNPDGDVTVVEFFDYNCPYCRRAKPEIEALLERDPNIRIVMREWPILGDGSTFAARAALAARMQGKYEEFHWSLMGMEGRAEEASVLRIAQEVGLDIERLLADMDHPDVAAHIATSTELTQALGFSGTPSFVIGDALVPGVVDASELERLADLARAAEQ